MRADENTPRLKTIAHMPGNSHNTPLACDTITIVITHPAKTDGARQPNALQVNWRSQRLASFRIRQQISPTEPPNDNVAMVTHNKR